MASFVLSAFADEASPTLSGQIAALQRNHISLIEPRNIGGDVASKSEEELTAIRQTLDQAGIRTFSLGSPIGKDKIENDFMPHFEKFLHALRACEILGASRMRMFSFFVEQDSLTRYRDEVMKRLSRMLDEAEKHGITLCHENEAAIYGQNPDEVRDLLATLPRLHGIFDAANFIMQGQDAAAGLHETLKRLEYVHVKDARKAERVVTAAGEGDADYPSVIRKIDESTERTVVLTVESHLHIFDAFKEIDRHEFRSYRSFDTSDEAFDYAVGAIKRVLTDLGYKEDGYLWKK